MACEGVTAPRGVSALGDFTEKTSGTGSRLLWACSLGGSPPGGTGDSSGDGKTDALVEAGLEVIEPQTEVSAAANWPDPLTRDEVESLC